MSQPKIQVVGKPLWFSDSLSIYVRLNYESRSIELSLRIPREKVKTKGDLIQGLKELYEENRTVKVPFKVPSRIDWKE